MSKRVCQTCRHFRAAGFDNMGWCNHPKRRDGTEVKLLARSLELQCRNDWDNDLWQEIAEGDFSSFAIDRMVAPMRPVTPVEMAFIAASETRIREGSAAASGEDVVVAEVTPQFATNKAAAQGDGFKVGISKAHEELRTRHRAVRESVLPISSFGDAAHRVSAEPTNDELIVQSPGADGEVSLNNQHGAQPRPIIGEVSPVALGEMGRPFPKLTTFPEDDEIFSSIPKPVEGFDLPFVTKAAPERIVKRAGFDEDDREIKPWNHGSAAVEPAEIIHVPVQPVDEPVRPNEHERAVSAGLNQPEIVASTGRDHLLAEHVPFNHQVVETRRPVERVSRHAVRGEFDLSVFGDPHADLEPVSPTRPVRLTQRSSQYDERPRSESGTNEILHSEAMNGSVRDEFVLEERSVLRAERTAFIDERGPRDHSRPAEVSEEDKRPIRLTRPGKMRVEPVTFADLQAESALSDDFRAQEYVDNGSRRATRKSRVAADEYGTRDVSSEFDQADEMFDDRLTRSERPRQVRTSDVAYESEPVGAAPEASIPRMCKTCRDFRPAENGERGWCTNKWAFNHRRMVDAGELPCETTIGRWWLPHDDHWATAVDISGHSRPTPHLDQWLAQRAGANGEIESAQPIRRRHRS